MTRSVSGQAIQSRFCRRVSTQRVIASARYSSLRACCGCRRHPQIASTSRLHQRAVCASSLVAASRVVEMRAVLKAIETQGRYCHPSELKEALGLTTNSIGHFCASMEKAGDLVRIDVLPRKYAVWGLASHPLPDMDELREKCREYRRRWK